MALAFIRKTTWLILLFLGLFTSLNAQQNPQGQFDRANDHLVEGNLSQAVSLYKQIENQNTVSGALFLNMGIAYQRMDSLGKAKYYFLKASRFDETEERANQAVEYVDEQFSRQSAVLPKFPWDIAVDWLRHNLGATNILIFGIVLLNLGMIVFISRWFIHWYPEYLRISGLSLLIISILIILCSFYTDYVSDRYSKAVMITEKMPVLEQPNDESTLVSQAYEGYTFTVDHHKSETEPGWSYVRMSNGLYGWIPNSEILIL